MCFSEFYSTLHAVFAFRMSLSPTTALASPAKAENLASAPAGWSEKQKSGYPERREVVAKAQKVLQPVSYGQQLSPIKKSWAIGRYKAPVLA